MRTRNSRISRRTVCGLGLFVALTACAEAPSTVPVSSGFVPVRINVDGSGLNGITGREYQRSVEQIESDVSNALTQQIAVRADGNADVRIVLREVRLTSPGNAVAFGGRSRILALIQITDPQTGQALQPAAEITGFANQIRPGGLIGAALTPSAQNDYDQTLIGFAETVMTRLSEGNTPV